MRDYSTDANPVITHFSWRTELAQTEQCSTSLSTYYICRCGERWLRFLPRNALWIARCMQLKHLGVVLTLYNKVWCVHFVRVCICLYSIAAAISLNVNVAVLQKVNLEPYRKVLQFWKDIFCWATHIQLIVDSADCGRVWCPSVHHNPVFCSGTFFHTLKLADSVAVLFLYGPSWVSLT